MPYSSQDSKQPTIHGFTSSFEQPRTDVADASCLSTPQLCLCPLTLPMEGAVSSMGGSASSIYNPAVWSCLLGGSTVNSCSKYSGQQVICPSASDTRQHIHSVCVYLPTCIIQGLSGGHSVISPYIQHFLEFMYIGCCNNLLF